MVIVSGLQSETWIQVHIRTDLSGQCIVHSHTNMDLSIFSAVKTKLYRKQEWPFSDL